MAAASSRKYPIWIILVGILVGILLAVLVFFALIQLIPYGRDHTNPPVVQEPAWDTPETRALVKRACFDCHSNETTWPWYSNVAPISWMVARDVLDGRWHLNFSEWGVTTTHEGESEGEVEEEGESRSPDEIIHTITEGSMPPAMYLLTHPEAKLADTEKQALMDGLNKSLAP